MILWITGNSGSGKSTLAKTLKRQRAYNVWLDGDALRKVYPGLGLSKEDRWEHNMRMARIAKLLNEQENDVVLSSICPYRELRDAIRRIIPVQFVFLSGGHEPSEEYPYEPRQPDEGK